MLHIVLYEPEIPPNTGNIIRLCANSGAQLHLIHPMGFSLSDKQCRRAGLDYQEYAAVKEYQNFQIFLEKNESLRLFACSTKASNNYSEIHYQENDALVFGPETRGLPNRLLDQWPQQQKIRIPMQANSRSLNLSNAAAIILYEAWRQLDFS
jgi:tRNA (cytidine/uridine-2'-O-)-methyltransferase